MIWFVGLTADAAEHLAIVGHRLNQVLHHRVLHNKYLRNRAMFHFFMNDISVKLAGARCASTEVRVL